MEKRPADNSRPGVTRRDFIKGMGTGALGTAVLQPLLGQTIATKKGRVPVYDRKTITLAVNGRKTTLEVEANETLLDVLRDGALREREHRPRLGHRAAPDEVRDEPRLARARVDPLRLGADRLPLCLDCCHYLLTFDALSPA